MNSAADHTVLTDGGRAEACYALAERILKLRGSIRKRTAWHAIPPHPGFDRDRNLEHLHECALWLRQAEHAYRAIGGTSAASLPATARIPARSAR